MDDLLVKFESYVNEHKEEGLWKSILEIEKITGVDIHYIVEYVENSDDFIINTNRKWTTKRLYNSNTSFWKKIIDVYTHLYN